MAATSVASNHRRGNPGENGCGEPPPHPEDATPAAVEKTPSSTHHDAALAPDSTAQPFGVSGSVDAVAPPRNEDLAGRNGNSDEGSRPTVPDPAARSNGFSTARGRPLKVSAEALARVEHIFRESEPRSESDKAAGGANHPEARPEETSPGVGPAAARACAAAAAAPDGHAAGARERETHASTAAVAASAAVLSAGGGAFSTARGRPLAVSAEALARVQHLFEEKAAAASAIADDGGPGLAVAVGPAVATGATVSAPRAKAGATAAAAAPAPPAVLEAGGGGVGDGGSKSTGKDGLGWDGGSSFVGSGGGGGGGGGFQTGRGRALSVSSEALAKVQHLFSSNGDDDSSETPSQSLRSSGSIGAARYRQTTPKSGGKSFRSPAVIRKTRARGGGGVGGDADGAGASGFRHPARRAKPPTAPPRDAGAGRSADFPVDQGGDLPGRDRQESAAGPSIGPLGAAGGGGALASSLGAADKLAAKSEPSRDESLVREDPVGVEEAAAAAPAAAAPAIGASMSGFVTGRGRAVHVSAEALAKAGRLLAGASGGHGDDDEDGVEGGRSRAAAKEAATPASCLPRAEPSAIKRASAVVGSERELCNDQGEGKGEATEKTRARDWASEPSLISPSGGSGSTSGGGGGGGGSGSVFSTGRGRPIEVSTEALARVQAMFQDEPQDDANQATKDEHLGAHNQASDPQQPFGLKESTGGAGRTEGDTFSSPPGTRRTSQAPGCTGDGVAGVGGMFSTGSGRRVQVSAEALAQAQKRFGEVEVEVEVEAEGAASGTSRGHLPPPLGGSGGGGNGGSASEASDFSTGRGKSIEVSPAALSQAYKRFGAGADDQGRTSLPATRQPLSPRPTASGGWCGGAGKENRGQEVPKKRVVGTPSGTFRRPGAASTAFCPPGRLRLAMPPPAAAAAAAGAPTPSSSGKLVGTRATTPSTASGAGGNTAGGAASATSLAGAVGCIGGGGSADSTPQSAVKRRSFGGGYGGGLHAVKRSRLSVSAAATTPSASTASPMRALTTPRGLRLSGGAGNGSGVRGAFPRPSPARLAAAATDSGGGAVGLGVVAGSSSSSHPATATPVDAAGEDENDAAGCRASRMLFGALGSPEKGSTEAATAGESLSARKEEESRRRHRQGRRGRRPLSSLLDPPPQLPAESRQRHSSGAASAGAGTGGDQDEDDHRVPASDEARAEAGKHGGVDAGGGGQLGTKPPPADDLESRRAGGGGGGEPVEDLLAHVTAENACDLRFGNDGRPLCFAPSCGSRTTTTGGGAEGQEREEAEHVPAASPVVFRDELVRSGRDGQMATPAWVKNHTR